MPTRSSRTTWRLHRRCLKAAEAAVGIMKNVQRISMAMFMIFARNSQIEIETRLARERDAVTPTFRSFLLLRSLNGHLNA